MNVALVGSSGYIAGYLQQYLLEKQQIDKIMTMDLSNDADYFLDLCNAEEFEYEVLKAVDVIIFTAAVSGPDQCAKKFDLCWRINVTGTQYFIERAIKQGCRVLFFSSDAVFGNDEGVAFTEKSKTNAVTPYGRMKKAVEDRFIENENFKAIRLSYVVSGRDKFVSYCLRCIEKGETAEVYHPFYRNCVTIAQVAGAVEWLISRWDKYEPSFLNVAGTELVSRLRIADELNRILNNRLKYSIVYPGEAFYENRHKITHMESVYMQKYSIIELKNFTEELKSEIRGIEI